MANVTATTELNAFYAASQAIETAAYIDMLGTLLDMEKKASEKIDSMSKKLSTEEDTDEIKKTKQNKKIMEATQKEINTLITATMQTLPDDWINQWGVDAYNLGAKSVEMSLVTADLLGNNVDYLFAAHNAIQENPLDSFPVKASLFRTNEAYNDYNKDLNKWMTDTLSDAYIRGIPLGDFTDIGKDNDTLFANLLKSDTRLRGYIMTDKNGNPRHIPAEQHAQAIARNEMVNIENDVAFDQASDLGLTYAYNANPNDLTTTEICRRATAAGNMLVDDMIKRFGKPPRIFPDYHLCRSLLIYNFPEWIQ